MKSLFPIILAATSLIYSQSKDTTGELLKALKNHATERHYVYTYEENKTPVKFKGAISYYDSGQKGISPEDDLSVDLKYRENLEFAKLFYLLSLNPKYPSRFSAEKWRGAEDDIQTGYSIGLGGDVPEKILESFANNKNKDMKTDLSDILHGKEYEPKEYILDIAEENNSDKYYNKLTRQDITGLVDKAFQEGNFNIVLKREDQKKEKILACSIVYRTLDYKPISGDEEELVVKTVYAINTKNPIGFSVEYIRSGKKGDLKLSDITLGMYTKGKRSGFSYCPDADRSIFEDAVLWALDVDDKINEIVSKLESSISKDAGKNNLDNTYKAVQEILSDNEGLLTTLEVSKNITRELAKELKEIFK